MFLSVVILGRFTTETHAMAPLHRHRHAATYTTPGDVPREQDDRAQDGEAVPLKRFFGRCAHDASRCRPQRRRDFGWTSSDLSGHPPQSTTFRVDGRLAVLPDRARFWRGHVGT